MSEHSTEPFMKALSKLLRDTEHASVDAEGNINWAAFTKDLKTVHYETFRKIKAGDRLLVGAGGSDAVPRDMAAIEDVAAAAGVAPDYFAEYRLLEARQLFDPRVVGFDQAVANYNERLRGDDARPQRKAQARKRPGPQPA